MCTFIEGQKTVRLQEVVRNKINMKILTLKVNPQGILTKTVKKILGQGSLEVICGQ